MDLKTFKIIPVKLCLLLGVFCLWQTAYSQEFFKKYYHGGNNEFGYIQALTDGAFVTMRNGSSHSLILSKYNPCGDLEWSYLYQSNIGFSTTTNSVNLLQIDHQMRPVFATNAFGNGQGFWVIIRFSEDGKRVELSKKFSLQNNVKEILDFYINDDGDYWIGGAHGWGKGEIGAIKLDTAGNILYSHSYEFPFSGYSQFMDFSGKDSFLAGSDTSIMFVNKPGDVKWQSNFSGIDIIRGAAKTYYGHTLIGNISQSTTLFRINNSGHVIPGGQNVKHFQPWSLKTDQRGNLLSWGWNVITDSASSEIYPAIMELDANGQFQRNIQVGTSPNYYIGSFGPVELKDESLYGMVQLTDNTNGNLSNQLMVGRMSMEAVNFFCNDTSIIDTSTSSLVTGVFTTPAKGYPLTLKDSIFYLTSLPHIYLTTTECTATRDFSKLFTIDSLSICRGDLLDITRPGLHGTSFKWFNGDTTETIRAETTGSYWVAMTFPCDPQTYYDTVYVTLYPEPDFDIIIDPKRADIGESIDFTYQSASSTEPVYWDFGDSTVSIDRYTTHSYGASGKYIITTTILTEDSCLIEVTDTVYINKQQIEVPNVFTPNEDGQNDLMTIKGEDIADYTLNIYNIYGVLVKSQQNLPWNGNAENGQKASDGVYYYVLNYTLHDGSPGSKSGSVTLFRNSTR